MKGFKGEKMETTAKLIKNCNMVETASMAEEIKIGDLVKAFDFKDRPDCYIVGVVIGTHNGGEFDGDKWVIEAKYEFTCGEVRTINKTICAYKNGTPDCYGNFTNFVRKV